MNFTIRKLKKNDFQKGFLETLNNLFPVMIQEKKAKQIFRQVSSNPFYHFIIAEQNGDIIGTLSLLIEQKFILRGSKFAHIEDVVIRKGYERKGIGTRLLQEAMRVARKEKCRVARLDCNKTTVGFYEKNGFYRKRGVFRMQIKLMKDLF